MRGSESTAQTRPTLLSRNTHFSQVKRLFLIISVMSLARTWNSLKSGLGYGFTTISMTLIITIAIRSFQRRNLSAGHFNTSRKVGRNFGVQNWLKSTRAKDFF